MRCALYRHFSEDETLLYVGISLAPLSRLGRHRGYSTWKDEIKTVRIEYFLDSSSAEQAERIAIKLEKPLHNTTHSGIRSPRVDAKVAKSRHQAVMAKAKRYYGSMCRQGHGDLRYTMTGNCVECDRMNQILRRKNLKEAAK